MDILEGEYSLASLIKHHQNKITLLKKLKTQLNAQLDKESQDLIKQIWQKPEKKVTCLGAPEELKPCFANELLALLQKNHGTDKDGGAPHGLDRN